jgi:glycosyltransferase involved in cell wall biosynthesis
MRASGALVDLSAQSRPAGAEILPDGRALAFLWDNIGPIHADRLATVAAAFPWLTAIEYLSESSTYGWEPGEGPFRRVTLFEGGVRPSRLQGALRLIGEARSLGRGDYFLCHYDWPEVFALACYLRLSGSRAFAMLDAKFDDKPRRAWFEATKSLALAPYHGALAGSPRTTDYLRFLGMRRKPIEQGYDTISIGRIRRLAGVDPAPAGVAHGARDFVCVARLVPKKNHTTLLAAYARYRELVPRPRDLHLCGNGPEQDRLEAQVGALGLGGQVHFQGFVQAEGVAQQLGRALALLLPSTEEQFGQVVLEAQAMGLPVIVSDQVGARDRHVRSGVNGFVVEATNAEGLARYMAMLDGDEGLWRRMAAAAREDARRGDVAEFVAAVRRLIAAPRR